MIAGAAGGGGTREAQFAEVEFFDEDINHSHRILGIDVLVETGGQQRKLGALFALDKSAHLASP